MDRSRQVLSEVTFTHHQTLNTNQHDRKEARAPDAERRVPMDRQDSGFGDSWTPRFKASYLPRPPERAMASTSSPTSTIRQNVKLTENAAPQRTAQRTAAYQSLRQRSSQGPSTSTEVSVDSRSPRSTTPLSSYRSTTATSSLPNSNTSSRKSSVTSHNQKASAAACQSLSAGHGRPCSEKALALHRRSVQLFPPFRTSLEPPPTFDLDSRRHTSPTITSISSGLHHHLTTRPPFIDEPAPESLRDGPYQYENFVPASSIDWTHPSTREREYRKIERSYRGLRGLWRRLAPRWCHRKSSHLNFFREDDMDDAGSVRRYRLEAAGNGDGTKCEADITAAERAVDSRLSKANRLRRSLSFWRSRTTPVRGSESEGDGKGEEYEMERLGSYTYTPLRGADEVSTRQNMDDS